MKIGYARVSTQDQNLDLQIAALEKEGCEKIYTDRFTGKMLHRPGLNEALSFIKPGDTFVIWRVDRLGRNTREMMEFATKLHDRGIGFKSITEGVDTTTPMGELFFTIAAGCAQMEARLNSERTKAGLAAAKARGRIGGRRSKFDAEKFRRFQELHQENKLNIREIERTTQMPYSSFHRYRKMIEAGEIVFEGIGHKKD